MPIEARSFGSEAPGKAETRFDLANLSIQRYGDSAVASYTLLVSTALPEGVRVVSHNESRVIVKQDGKWKVVHVHKSPSLAGAARATAMTSRFPGRLGLQQRVLPNYRVTVLRYVGGRLRGRPERVRGAAPGR